MSQHLHTLLAPRLAGSRDPDPVLIGASLHAEEVVEGAKLVLFRPIRQLRGRVVAEQHHLRALERHDAIGLGPAAVVANAHSDPGAEALPDGETEIARLEIERLQM